MGITAVSPCVELLPQPTTGELPVHWDGKAEVDLLSLRAGGLDSLIPRGLPVLCSFPEEVGLVYPPYFHSGLAT